MPICRHCNMEFVDQPQLMRHSRWDCLKNPKSKSFISITVSKQPDMPKKDITKVGAASTAETEASVATGFKSRFNEMYRELEDEMKFLQAKKMVQSLKSEISDDKDGDSHDNRTITYVYEGATLRLSPSEFIAFKDWESRQSNKNVSSSSEVAKLREEISLMREGFLQSQIEILKSQVARDPFAEFVAVQDKLGKLGLGSSEPSAAEHMMNLDGKKTDTLMKLVCDKSISMEHKFDKVIETFGPAAKTYVESVGMALKQQRTMPEVPRSDAEFEYAASELDKVAKEFVKRGVDNVAPPTDTAVAPVKKPISIPKTNHKSKEVKNVPKQ